jgi:Rab GDP dissociation inhibitor
MEMDLSLLQGEFDCIILGTGLIECTLSGVLSKDGLRVLVLDKNDYYGGGCASLSLPQLYAKIKNEQLDNEQLVRKFGGPAGASSLEQRRWLNEWNLDLIPKFIMGSGLLSRILVHTGVTKYLQFQKAAGSFVYKEGKIHKVPIFFPIFYFFLFFNIFFFIIFFQFLN